MGPATLEALEVLEERKDERERCDRIIWEGSAIKGETGGLQCSPEDIRGQREMPGWENCSRFHAFAERAAGNEGCWGLEGGGPGGRSTLLGPGPQQGVRQSFFKKIFLY